jgi:HK97 family phage prohead protease
MNYECSTLAAVDVRFATIDDVGTFEGYASVFGEPDSYGDTIKPGAFKKAVALKSKPAMFWQHDPAEPIGAWLDLAEDTRGLKVKGKLVTEVPRAAAAYALIKANALNGMSIGFRARASERGPNGGRVLTDIELIEISLVSLPAASKARITSVKGAATPAGLAAFAEACRRTAAAIKRDPV